MASTVISFPVPLYQNFPIQPLFFKPRVFTISAIALGTTTTITTSTNNDYVIGQQVRLIIPKYFGSFGLNEQTGYVIAISSPNQVTINLSSLGVDPFIPSPPFFPFNSHTVAQILAIGDINSGQINNNGRVPQGTFIPGSFENVSPQTIGT